jgi:hypothetical protein
MSCAPWSGRPDQLLCRGPADEIELVLNRGTAGATVLSAYSSDPDAGLLAPACKPCHIVKLAVVRLYLPFAAPRWSKPSH